MQLRLLFHYPRASNLIFIFTFFSLHSVDEVLLATICTIDNNYIFGSVISMFVDVIFKLREHAFSDNVVFSLYETMVFKIIKDHCRSIWYERMQNNTFHSNPGEFFVPLTHSLTLSVTFIVSWYWWAPAAGRLLIYHNTEKGMQCT